MTVDTDFSNKSIDSQALPQIETLDFQPLSEHYAVANLVIFALSMLATLAILTFAQYQSIHIFSHDELMFIQFLSIAILFFGSVMASYRFIADKQKAFSIREHDLSFRSGLIFSRLVTQPITRIQHIELKRGPIDRQLGLAKLHVFSAGGAAYTFEIPGLPVATATKLRAFVLDHADIKTHG